jgi:hypothetical protein
VRRLFSAATAIAMMFLIAIAVSAAVAATGAARTITWADLPAAIHPLLESRGLTSAGFPAFVARERETTAQRVREGQLDHVIFYALQSTQFTTMPAIEPALSAKAVVDSLDADTRARLAADPLSVPIAVVPQAVDQRITALLAALERAAGQSDQADARLRLFARIVQTAFPDRHERRVGLLHAYLRAMRFLYQKEFESRGASAKLYQTRGLSTDTAVEAGYLVHFGLATMQVLSPASKVRRALIIGPGLDLAPRTGLLETAPPQSYQPWAVIDALVSLGLSRLDDLEVVAADINPVVVDHLNAASKTPPTLVMISGIANNTQTTLTDDYRDYFTTLGRSIGDELPPPAVDAAHAAHLRKTVRVSPSAARVLHAERLDLVTERLQGRFDLIIITNVLPYFDDRDLTLAVTSLAAMLEPGGHLLHNEPRPFLGEITSRVGLPFIHSRSAIIANVHGSVMPLVDSVFIHGRI